MKLTPEQIAELIASLPWKMDAKGYAIIKRSHLVVFLSQGKAIQKGEIIHHHNENKADDRPENLEILARSDHAKHHRSLKNHRGAVYTPELIEKRRQQMAGNRHSVGNQKSPEVRAMRSVQVSEVWRKRREGLLPFPKHHKGDAIH